MLWSVVAVAVVVVGAAAVGVAVMVGAAVSVAASRVPLGVGARFLCGGRGLVPSQIAAASVSASSALLLFSPCLLVFIVDFGHPVMAMRLLQTRVFYGDLKGGFTLRRRT